VLLGYQTYVGPYASLSAVTGLIKIAPGADIQANAVIDSNPTGVKYPTTSVIIGRNSSVGPGAFISGPTTIGGLSADSAPAGVGANAVIVGATVMPGSFVGALAHVGPGVTVPSGYLVLPGANVTNDAEASDPALGMVEPITTAQLASLKQVVANYQALAAGYTQVYQGNSATGTSIGTSTSGVYNGNLAAIEGASAEPGSGNGPKFEPSTAWLPSFLSVENVPTPYAINTFKARVVGHVVFGQHADQVAAQFGRGDVILGDQGQPVTFNGPFQLGDNVSILSPGITQAGQGAMTFGSNLMAGNGVVIEGGTASSYVFGDNVTVDSHAVIVNSSIGSGSTIGAGAYVAGSNLRANTDIPAGAIVIDGVITGYARA
jgi:carbonic anhydrase/acetyltransferase-like protein (isoleucine patch superfamily)